MTARSDGHGLVLGVRATEMRRQVGLLPWCALEALVARSRISDEGPVADVSARSLALELAVAVNTAQRALSRLRSARLIEHRQPRGPGGHFDVAVYRLMIPAEVLRIASPNPPSVIHSTANPPRLEKVVDPAMQPSEIGEQLVLSLPT